MPNDDLTRAEYLNALLQQKRQLKESGMNLVNPSLSPLASIDTSFQKGVDKTGVPTEQDIKNVTKPKKNGWETAMDNIFGFVDEIVAKFGAGFVGGFEGILDLGATAIGAFGDATGWYEGDAFTDWAKQDVGTALAEWNKTYGLSLGSIKNLVTGRTNSGQYWSDAWNSLTDIADTFIGDTDLRDMRGEADKYYSANDEVLQQMGGFGDFLGGASYSIGFMLPSILTGGGSTVATLGTMFLSSAGKGAEQALTEGATADKALAYGVASGTVEVATEVLMGKMLKGAAKALHLDDLAKGFGKVNGVSIGRDMIGKVTAKQFAASMLEEGGEEVVSTLFQPVIESIYKGESAFYDENGRNVYQTPKFWSDVGTAFLSGSFVSGLTGGVETIRTSKRYGKDGLVFIENNKKYNELVDEYKKQQFKKQDTTQIEKEIKELALTIAENLETLAKSENKKQLENLMFDYAKSVNKKLSKKTWTSKDTLEMKKTFKESFETPVYKKMTNDINSVLEEKGSKMRIRWATEQELYEGLETQNNEPYYDNAGQIRGFYIPSEGTVVINEKYSNEVGSIIKHELVSHAILDTNDNSIKSIVKYIESDKELSKIFHQHDSDIEKEYSKDEFESERLATFVENYIDDYDSFIDAIEGNKSLKSKMVTLLRRIKRAFTEKTGILNNKLLKNVEKSLDALLNNETSTSTSLKGEEPAIQFSKKLGKEIYASPITYMGNKFKLMEEILPYFPKTEQVERFIDAFGGSLTVSINVDYTKKIVNEKHPLLVKLYEFLLQNKADANITAKKIVDVMKQTATKFKLNTKEGFDALKKLYNDAPKSEKKALYLFLLTKYGTSGTYLSIDDKTYDYKGEWSPKNANPNWNLVLSKVSNFRKKLVNRNTKIGNLDAIGIIDRAKEGDFIYCDPPYLGTNAVYNEGWTMKDDIRLMEALDRASERGVKFALSDIFTYNGVENKHWIEWAKKYQTFHFNKKYHHGEADEVLIRNYNEKGEIINVEKAEREKARRYSFDEEFVKNWGYNGDIQAYFNKEWKRFYENASVAEKRFLKNIYEAKISILTPEAKENFENFYYALDTIKKDAFDKENKLKFRYWTPEMKMLYDELRGIGVTKVGFLYDDGALGFYNTSENEIAFNLMALSSFYLNANVQQLIRHERNHFVQKKYPELYNQFAKNILKRIDNKTYKKLLTLDSHGDEYARMGAEIVKTYGGKVLSDEITQRLDTFENIELPFDTSRKDIVLFNNIMLLGEVLADIYAQKSDRIDVLKKVIPLKEINYIVNSLDAEIEKVTKTKIKFSKTFGHEVSASTVKGAAVEKVITLDDTTDVVNEVFERIKSLLPSDVEIKMPNKLLASRIVFNEYNLKTKKEKMAFLTKVIENIFETEIDFIERNPDGSATGTIFTGTFSDYLTIAGYDAQKIVGLFSSDFYTALDLKSKTSERQKVLIDLGMRINYLKGKVKSYKRKIGLTFKAYRGICKLKEEIKNSEGVQILNQLFDKGWFTSLGNFSGRIRKKAFELSQKGADGETYFDKVTKMIENEGVPFPIEVIDFYKELATTYILPTTAKPNPRQKVLDNEEIEKFVAVTSLVRKTYEEYKEGIYKDVEEKAIEGTKKYNVASSVLSSQKKTLSFTAFNLVQKFTNPISNLRMAGLGTEFIETNVIEPTVNAYGSKRLEQTKLLTVFRETITEKSEIYKKANAKVKLYDKKVSRYNLYSLYLNLMCDYNGVNIVEEGFSVIESNGQKFKFKPRVVKTYDPSKTAQVNKLEHEMRCEVEREKMLDEIREMLTEKEIKELEQLSDFLNKGDLKKYVKSAQIKVDGFSTLLDERYFPMTIEDARQPVDVTKKQSSGFLVDASNISFLKARTGAKNPVRMVNPIAMIEAYIDSITNYGEITQAQRKVSRIMNRKIAINGVKTTVIAEIESYTPHFKEHYISYISKLLGIDVSKGKEIWDGLGGKYSTAVLGFNIGSMLTQVASLPFATMVTGVKSGVKALTKSGTYNPKKLAKDHKWLMENNGIYAYRVSQHGMVKAMTTSSQFHQTANVLLNKITDVTLLGMEKLDQLWCLISFQFAQEEIASKFPDKPVGSEENLKEASKLFDYILLETQSNSDPIAKSMLRSGELGKLTQYMFGIFASDAQTKLSKFVEAFVGLTRTKRLLKSLKKMMDTNDYEGLDENAVKSLYQEMASKNYRTDIARYGANLIASGLLAYLAALLRDLLYGRKELEDLTQNPWEEIGLPMLLETYVEWIPVVGQLASYFKYESLNVMPLQTVLSILDNLKQLSDGFATGKLSNGAMTNLIIQLAQLLGLPANNIKNLFMGITNIFDAEQAIKTDNLLYARSQNYFVGRFYNYADKGNNKKAKATLKEYLSAYKLDVDDEVVNELTELYALKYSCLPKNRPLSYTNEVGEEVKFTAEEIRKFSILYSKANNTIHNLLNDSEYKSATQENRAKMIKKFFDAYYDLGYAQIKKDHPMTKIAKWLANNVENPNIAKYIVALQKIAQITENGSKTRKQLVIAYVNSLTTLTKAEKTELLMLAGFNPTK